MARKTLLTEGEIRQFMKLAHLPALGAGRMQEVNGPNEMLGMGALGVAGERDELEDEEVAVDELPGGEEEMGIEDEVEVGGVEGGEGAEELVMDLLGRIEEWAEENGVSMDVEGDDAEGVGGEEELVGVEDEVAVDDMGGEEELAMGVEEEPMMEKRARRHKKTSKNEVLGTLGKAVGGIGDVAGGLVSGDRDESGETEAWDQWKNEHADDDHIKEIEHHLDALKGDRDYEEHGAEYDHDKYEDEGDDGQESQGHDAIVAEVARRVAARLAGAQKNDALSEKLAERILKRLTSAK